VSDPYADNVWTSVTSRETIDREVMKPTRSREMSKGETSRVITLNPSFHTERAVTIPESQRGDDSLIAKGWNKDRPCHVTIDGGGESV
jgi:hypothetical protein